MLTQRDKARAKIWTRLWQQHWDTPPAWDSLSEIIRLALLRETVNLQRPLILEAGCGSARISARLAENSARVVLLDITPAALRIAKANCRQAILVQGSVHRLPFAQVFDLIWNAGVLEHFNKTEQRQILDEFSKVLRPGGSIVVFTPFAGSLLYRIAKYFLERTGGW